jgi:hypothetical protein
MSLMTGHSSYTPDAALRPISPTNETPIAIAAKLAELGTGAWIALTIIGFILWWPVGLALLALANGSGMAYRNVTRLQEIMESIQDTVDRMGKSGSVFWVARPRAAIVPSTNTAQRPCVVSSRNTASLKRFSSACGSRKTRPSSTCLWPSGEIATAVGPAAGLNSARPLSCVPAVVADAYSMRCTTSACSGANDELNR